MNRLVLGGPPRVLAFNASTFALALIDQTPRALDEMRAEKLEN
jgi:hypothetical protein